MRIIRLLLFGCIVILLFWGCGYQSAFAPDLGATTAVPTPSPNNQCQPSFYSWPGNGTWTQVGQADFGGSGGAQYLSLAISPCGAPYVAYVEPGA